MSIEEIIKWLEGMIYDPEEVALPIETVLRNEMAREAIALLKTHPDAQPNMALTKRELQDMDGQPAWCKEDEAWGIVEVESSGPWALIPFFCEHKEGVSFTLDIEKRHLTIYRRPPKEDAR